MCGARIRVPLNPAATWAAIFVAASPFLTRLRFRYGRYIGLALIRPPFGNNAPFYQAGLKDRLITKRLFCNDFLWNQGAGARRASCGGSMMCQLIKNIGYGTHLPAAIPQNCHVDEGRRHSFFLRIGP